MRISKDRQKLLSLRGVVRRSYNGIVDVKVRKDAQCSDCEACFKGSQKTLKIPSDKTFAPDTDVLIEIPCWMVYRLSFLFYFIPTIFAVMGFSIGYSLLSNLGGFLGAIIFLMITYQRIRAYTKVKYDRIVRIKKL